MFLSFTTMIKMITRRDGLQSAPGVKNKCHCEAPAGPWRSRSSFRNAVESPRQCTHWLAMTVFFYKPLFSVQDSLLSFRSVLTYLVLLTTSSAASSRLASQSFMSSVRRAVSMR